MTRRALVILEMEDDQLSRDAPCELFDQYRAIRLARLIELAAEIEVILTSARSQIEGTEELA